MKTQLVKCLNCAGKKIIEKFKHVDGGICYACEGSGVVREDVNEKLNLFDQVHFLISKGETKFFKFSIRGDIGKVEKFELQYCKFDDGYFWSLAQSTELLPLGDVRLLYKSKTGYRKPLSLKEIDRLVTISSK